MMDRQGKNLAQHDANMADYVQDSMKMGSLKLAFQPAVDSRSGKPIFYEALARIQNGKGGWLSPGFFIPLIEEKKMTYVFDQHILDLAIGVLLDRPDVHLAINISGLTAIDEAWGLEAMRKLQERPDIASRLIVEVTETAISQDFDRLYQFIKRLQVGGVRVALDDMGAGFTSVRHLYSLPISILKIDRALVHGILQNLDQQNFVHTLIVMAHNMGVQVVAEGIEDEVTAQWLREKGADMMQGYYFARPSFDLP